MYVPLHGHSDYSILDGCAGIKQICQRSQEVGLEHIALTDHGSMAGVFEFHHTLSKAGVHPILGVEAYITDDRTLQALTDEDKKGLSKEEVKEKTAARRKYNHVGLLAKNNKGLKNLFELCSDAAVNGFYYKPRTDWDTLAKHSEGVIMLSGCLSGRMNRLIQANEIGKARKHLLKMYEIFGKRLLVELQVNESEEQKVCNRVMVHFARKYNMPLVVTNDYHYICPDSQEPHRMWKYLDYKKGKSKVDVDFCNFQGYPTTGHFIASYEQLREQWIRNHGNLTLDIFEQACRNTIRVAEACRVTLDPTQKMVEFPLPEGMDRSAYLRKLVTKGWQKRRPFFVEGKDYAGRLQFEIDTIREMGYLDYFFVVHDAISWCKHNNVPIGPGRGSAAGCLLSWLLGITEVDPLRYGLYFERFLNPYRKKMPDIDVDVCKANRERLVEYLKNKWGEDRIAAISTYNRFSPKSLFRDVAKGLGAEHSEVNEIGKKIDRSKSWEENIASDDDIADYAEENPRIADYMDELDGRIRQAGTHAAGFVLTPTKISDYCALRRVKGKIQVELEMDWLDKYGIGKYDWLGLKTLTQLKASADLAGMTWEELEQVQYDDDPRVFKLFNEEDTVGVFQFWQSGMTHLAKQMGIESINDLSDCNTMYRPAVLDDELDQLYVRRKHGEEPIEYLHEDLREILEPTYGVIIYQEQIIEIMAALGLDTGEADLVRKDMENISKGKVPKEKMDEWFAKCRERGWGGFSEDDAQEIVDQIMRMIGYLFNKAHSTAYSILGHMCQWLKVNHPMAMMIGFLNFEDELDKIEELLDYFSRRYGLEIGLGDISTFADDFELDGKKIKVGVSRAKGLSSGALEMIVENRPYQTLRDFFGSNVHWGRCKKNHIMILGELGMFNGMSLYEDGPVIENSNEFLHWYEGVREAGGNNNNYLNKKACGDAFDTPGKWWLKTKDQDALPPRQIWQMKYRKMRGPTFMQTYDTEIKFFEFCIRYNPLAYLKANFDKAKCMQIFKTQSRGPWGRKKVNVEPHLGLVTKIKPHIDRRGGKMAFLGLKTPEGLQDVTVFARMWGLIQKKQPIAVGTSGIFYLTKGDRGGWLLADYAQVQPPDFIESGHGTSNTQKEEDEVKV